VPGTSAFRSSSLGGQQQNCSHQTLRIQHHHEVSNIFGGIMSIRRRSYRHGVVRLHCAALSSMDFYIACAAGWRSADSLYFVHKAVSPRTSGSRTERCIALLLPASANIACRLHRWAADSPQPLPRPLSISPLPSDW
jgi:hypothetical protein